MQRSSFFYYDKARFGGYPTAEELIELEEAGVRHFVDLTCEGELLITQYTTKYNYIRYPIVDRSIPHNRKSFSKFILQICEIIINLPESSMIYIHCRGGCGRSGLVVACIISRLCSVFPYDALRLTSIYHANRPVMSSRMRKNGAPQTPGQKNFVKEFMGEYRFTTGPFTMSSKHPVFYKDELFETASLALQKHPGKLKPILRAKLEQHEDIKDYLLDNLRSVVYMSRTDTLLGRDSLGRGSNALGIILENLRDEMLRL